MVIVEHERSDWTINGMEDDGKICDAVNTARCCPVPPSGRKDLLLAFSLLLLGVRGAQSPEL